MNTEWWYKKIIWQIWKLFFLHIENSCNKFVYMIGRSVGKWFNYPLMCSRFGIDLLEFLTHNHIPDFNINVDKNVLLNFLLFLFFYFFKLQNT